MLVQVTAQVQVGAVDGVEEQLGDALALDVHQVRLEERLGRLEALSAELDDPPIG